MPDPLSISLPVTILAPVFTAILTLFELGKALAEMSGLSQLPALGVGL
jgi:hypothetical protein